MNSFIKPSQVSKDSIDSIIPADIIHKAKGLVIMQVLKAGFLWSGRVGTGIVLSRLPGGWSGPSGIGTMSVGFGA